MSTTWKKAFSTLATASLLASLFATAVAAPVAAVSAPTLSGSASADADGVDAVILAIGGTVDSGETLKIEVTGGATIAGVSNTAWTISADKTNIQWTNYGGNDVAAYNGFLSVVSTKIGAFKVTMYKKVYGPSATFGKVTGQEATATFNGVANTALVTPTMIMTANSCPTTSGTTDVTTASSESSTAFYGDAVVCAWVLLAENSGGTVNLDITAGLSAWSWSIAPYGLLHTAGGLPATSVTKGADATTAVTVGGVTYLAVGKTVYANGSVGKTTVTWNGTYRGKAYSAKDTLTFTGPATGVTVSGGPISVPLGSYTSDDLMWSAKDANGIAVSGSSGDMTGGSSNATVAKVTAINADEVHFDCLTSGTAVLSIKTKTGVTPAFTSNGATVTCGAGAPATIKVTATATKVGGISTITATVTDAKGLRVVDSSTVTFAANGGIFIDPDTFLFDTVPFEAETENGEATISLWAPSVPSVITVLAQVGGKTGIGTVNVTASAPSTASAITARVGTGSYASTTRVARLGQSITWRANLGSAAAGKSVGVYMRSRNANGTWSTTRRWLTATANSSGVVTFKYTYKSAKWIQIRFSGTAGSTSYLGGVWR